MKGIKEAIASDFFLQDFIRNEKNDWWRQEDRPAIKPYYVVKHELQQTKGLLFQRRQKVIPEKL